MSKKFFHTKLLTLVGAVFSLLLVACNSTEPQVTEEPGIGSVKYYAHGTAEATYTSWEAAINAAPPLVVNDRDVNKTNLPVRTGQKVKIEYWVISAGTATPAGLHDADPTEAFLCGHQPGIIPEGMGGVAAYGATWGQGTLVLNDYGDNNNKVYLILAGTPNGTSLPFGKIVVRNL